MQYRLMKKQSESGLSNNLGIIVEAKHEYTKQLCNVIRPAVYDTLLIMYDHAVNSSESTNDILYHFQKELMKAPTWNSNVIKEETEKILASCSYFNELITAVFLSNVKILSSVKLGSKSKKFQLVIPTNENFVHNVYVKVCKKVYDNPYLFSLKKYNNNIMNNMADIFDLIDECTAHSVRDMLPIKNILESYISKEYDYSESESEDEPEELEEEPEGSDERLEEPGGSDERLEEPDEPKEVQASVMDNLFEEPREETKEISLGQHHVVAEDHSQDHSQDRSQDRSQDLSKDRQVVESPSLEDRRVSVSDDEQPRAQSMKTRDSTFFDDV